MSDPKGGKLECIRTDRLDPEVEKVLGMLEPGKFSPVIKTAWGCCIVKRKKMRDEDILSVVKEQAKTFAEDQMYQNSSVRKRAKIQYIAGSAPALRSVKSANLATTTCKTAGSGFGMSGRLKFVAHPGLNSQLYRNAVRVRTQTAKPPQFKGRRLPAIADAEPGRLQGGLVASPQSDVPVRTLTPIPSPPAHRINYSIPRLLNFQGKRGGSRGLRPRSWLAKSDRRRASCGKDRKQCQLGQPRKPLPDDRQGGGSGSAGRYGNRSRAERIANGSSPLAAAGTKTAASPTGRRRAKKC